MCRISYEKCVCFVFLVILAVLSCSGFRIDNLAMTDISKRNSHASRSLSLNSGGLHRLRHHRQLRAQARAAPVPQIPDPRPAPRAQRGRRGPCPEHDVSWKAYRAGVVVVAKVESKSSKCRDDCTVLFRVIEILKSSYAVDERIRLKFGAATAACEYDEATGRSHFLVRAKIDQSKEYILFLDTDGAHSFRPVFVPEVRRKKTLSVVRKVVSPGFRPKPLKLEIPKNGVENPYAIHPERGRSKRLKLVCRVRGFPIPIIYWKRNNTLLHPNSRQRITQKKRKSTLVIRNVTEADLGNYECVARGVDSVETSYPFPSRSRPSEKPTPGIYIDRKPCEEPMRTDWCLNGTCFYIEMMNEFACECDAGFTGRNCEHKLSDQSRF